MADKVTLFPAHSWQCPSCGEMNFTAAEIVEVTNEEAARFADEYGGEPNEWTTGNLVTSPDDVECSSCQKAFEVGLSWMDA
jgi:hypothetical protein